MSYEIPPLTPRSLTIGVFAYSVLPNLVFVRVPNERGRWMLTDRCVVEVPCTHCKAMVGEPCRRFYNERPRYSIGTHFRRRADGRDKNGGNYVSSKPYPKLRLRPDEIEAPTIEPGEDNDHDPTDPG